MNTLAGIYPALITPYTKDGAVNEKQLVQIVNMLIEKGVTGFYVTGSTGECFLLSTEERKAIVEVVTDVVGDRAKVIVHVGCISTQHSIDLAKHAEKCGASAISAIAPFYYKFSFEEIKNHYNSIMNEVNLPMIAYNFPALIGFAFSTANVLELCKNPNFKGIKHTSLDLYQLEIFKRSCPTIEIFNGHDEVFLGGLSLGADGAIGSTFNIMAGRFIRIMELFKTQQMEEAKEEQIKANQIIDALIYSGVNQGIKYILEKQGFECNGCRLPMKRITEDAAKRLDSVLPLLES